MTKLIVDVECGAKECGGCKKALVAGQYCGLYTGACRQTFHAPALRLPACLAAEADLTRLVEACRGLLTMMNRGPQPRKLDEALTWRENDELARINAKAALAPFEEKK